MTIFGLAQVISLFIILMCFFLKKWRFRILIGACSIVFATLILHAVITSSRKKGFHIFSLPEQPSRSSFFQNLIDEKDIVFIGTTLYTTFADLMPFQDAFDKQFDDLEKEIGWPLSTPILSALFEKNSVSQNWVTEFTSQDVSLAQPAIYLHGAFGSYTIQCWLVASIMRQQGYSVICPALSLSARWTSSAGEKVLSRAIQYNEKKYPGQKILFIGLSNGAFGLTRYRQKLSDHAKGFILISGGEAVHFKDSLPTLLLWGQKDESISFQQALKIKKLNSNVTLESTDEDHSAFARQHEYFASRVLSWLTNLRN